MHKIALIALGMGLCVAGCGPAPDADDPHDALRAERAAPPPEPVVVVVQCPAAAACPQPVAPPPVVTVVPQPVVVAPAAPPPEHDPYVRMVIARQMDRFQRCYEKGLRRHPGLSGTVVVRMRIDPDGEVDKAFDYGSTLPDRHVVDCVVNTYERIHFKRPVGPTLIDHIDFRPS